VRAQGVAGGAVVATARAGSLGASRHADFRREIVAVAVLGGAALVSLLLAFVRSGSSFGLVTLGMACLGALAVVVVVGVRERRRVRAERRAAIDVVWHHRFCSEQASVLDIEVGWLRALAAALRARGAFDAHQGEGGQLAELATWRPDLEAVVVEVAKSSIAPPRASPEGTREYSR
jgi:hypothetical protein